MVDFDHLAGNIQSLAEFNSLVKQEADVGSTTSVNQLCELHHSPKASCDD